MIQDVEVDRVLDTVVTTVVDIAEDNEAIHSVVVKDHGTTNSSRWSNI